MPLVAIMTVGASSEGKLVRVLKLRDLYFLIVGGVIGSGIFVVPANVLAHVKGSIGLAMLVWIGGGFLSLLGALTYGELSAMRPKAGGLYVYIHDCFGPLAAFLYGWSLFFVIANAAISTLAVAFSAYLNQIIPMQSGARTAFSMLMIAVVTIVNVRGTRESCNLQNWTTLIKVSAILILTAILVVFGKGFDRAVELWPKSYDRSLAAGFGVAMIGVLWAYEGWQFTTFSAAEVINPQRDYPRGFLFGLWTLILLYLLANIGYLFALGPAEAAASSGIAAESLTAVAGKWAGNIVAAAILISIFSAANAIILTSSRVFYTMAADGLFFARLAEVHPRFKTPAFSIVIGSAWAATLALTRTFEQLFTYVVFTGWIFYALGAASVFVYRRRHPARELPYRTPGYPATPIFFILSGLALVANTLVARPREAAIGLLIVISGIPAYLYWRRRATTATTSLTGV